MTDLVLQRGNYDCGIAALAMATRKSYEDTLSGIGNQAQHIGVTANETCLYLLNIGHKSSYLMTKEAVALNDPDVDNRLNLSSMDTISLLCTKKMPAILTVKVPSGGLHAVYFDGIRILCPKRGVQGAGRYFGIEGYVVFEAILV